jgi:cation diffusion facilitator family transporter
MKSSFRIQLFTLAVAVVLLIVKAVAYVITDSVAIYTDALESIVNVIAALMGTYSLYIAFAPKDENHPYGHGKIEFITSALEGAMIVIAGVMMLYHAGISFIKPHPINRIDLGLVLILITGLVNMGVGLFSIKKGKGSNSPVLTASGEHLLSDTYTTLGIVAGLILFTITKWQWIDGLTAAIFGAYVMLTGFKIIRKSIAGVMDETDIELVKELAEFLENNRQPNWIDIHNLRVIKYGSSLHIDCHLTLPFFYTIQEAHDEQDLLNNLISSKFGNRIEMFVHIDSCQEFSCSICIKQDCTKRKHPLKNTLQWNWENMTKNQKHFN